MSHDYLDEEVKVQESEMAALRKRQEAAMQRMNDKIEHMDKQQIEEVSAAMQAFETRVAARRLFHSPDSFELMWPYFSDVVEDKKGKYGKGGLNVWRLVSKRSKREAESVATRLTGINIDSLPLTALQNCKKVEHIRCYSLRSLEGCPDRLRSLVIRDGHNLESLEPLSLCKELDTLEIRYAEPLSPWISSLVYLSA